jgi:hypothetical protein
LSLTIFILLKNIYSDNIELSGNPVLPESSDDYEIPLLFLCQYMTKDYLTSFDIIPASILPHSLHKTGAHE